ncbi:MAG: DUF4245 domain-containing protein [Nocardioidaceae bacterium]
MTQTDDGQQQAPQRARGSSSVGDMVRSIVVLLVLIVGIGALFTRTDTSSSSVAPTVDYEAVAATAASLAPFELLAPSALPEGWRATSATFDKGDPPRWHLGVLANEEEYVGLEQTTLGEEATIDAFAGGTSAAGATMVDGQTWNVRRDAEAGRTALVRNSGGVTTLVIGTISQTDLEVYAASLTAA